MNIFVDAFGGDKAPLEIVKGAVLAVSELDVNVTLCGDEKKITAAAQEHEIDLREIKILHAPDQITMEEDPANILKAKTNSSMAEGMRSVASGKGDAFVSAGNTGALVMGSTFIIKRVKGVKRAMIGALLPTASGKPYLLVDTGANAECRPDFLVQFGIMGSIYMKKAMQIENPKVGLLNIGAEESKGGELQRETYKLLKEAPVNFVGNAEARDVPAGAFDVVVADGFSGNIVLKLSEGLGIAFSGMVKEIFMGNWKGKLAAGLVMDGLKAFKKKMDYTEYGGAPLIGFSKPVIKAHGSSNANAIKNAIRQADAYAKSGVIGEIENFFEKNKED